MARCTADVDGSHASTSALDRAGPLVAPDDLATRVVDRPPELRHQPRLDRDRSVAPEERP